MGSSTEGPSLFGSNSAGKDESFAQNGFEASLYETNKDGIINAADDVWQSLQVWQDKNTDGVSQGDELISLDTLGIVAISLNATQSGAFDESGNIHELISSFQWADGRAGDMVDVLLRQESREPSSSLCDMIIPSIWPAVELIEQNPALDEVMGMSV